VGPQTTCTGAKPVNRRCGCCATRKLCAARHAPNWLQGAAAQAGASVHSLPESDIRSNCGAAVDVPNDSPSQGSDVPAHDEPNGAQYRHVVGIPPLRVAPRATVDRVGDALGGRRPTVLYGPIHLPGIAPQNISVFAALRLCHTILAYLLFLAFTDMCAIVFHTFVLRDRIIDRMALWPANAQRRHRNRDRQRRPWRHDRDSRPRRVHPRAMSCALPRRLSGWAVCSRSVSKHRI
jgi:hypothetical protein